MGLRLRVSVFELPGGVWLSGALLPGACRHLQLCRQPSFELDRVTMFSQHRRLHNTPTHAVNKVLRCTYQNQTGKPSGVALNDPWSLKLVLTRGHQYLTSHPLPSLAFFLKSLTSTAPPRLPLCAENKRAVRFIQFRRRLGDFCLLTDEAGIHSSVVVMGESIEDAAALHLVRLVE